MKALSLTFKANPSPVLAAFDELLPLLRDAPDSFNEALLGLIDSGAELVRFDDDRSAAPIAGELTVVLQPSEFMNRLLTATRAGDFDPSILEIGHDLSSVGCLEPANEDRASAESQGSADACPRHSQRGTP